VFKKILPLCLLLTFSTSIAYADDADVYCTGGLEIAIPEMNSADVSNVLKQVGETTPSGRKARKHPKNHDYYKVEWNDSGNKYAAHFVCALSSKNTGEWKCSEKNPGGLLEFDEMGSKALHEVESTMTVQKMFYTCTDTANNTTAYTGVTKTVTDSDGFIILTSAGILDSNGNLYGTTLPTSPTSCTLDSSTTSTEPFLHIAGSCARKQ
jgi:hypothetical protein